MNTRNIVRPLFASLMIVGILLVVGLVRQPSRASRGRNVLNLQAPSFVDVANAETNPAELDIGGLLDQEAGISAYYKSPDAITLSQVRGQFRTIEAETADYIIGSVAVPNYAEHFDAHVYVHTNGWILAYYPRADPVSKIIDIKALTVNTTKLKNVVSAVASTAGAPFTDVTYYDFRYPNATNMLFVAEDGSNGDDFTIQLPSTFGYFERGWAVLISAYGWYFQVNGQNLPNVIYNSDSAAYGTLTASQLLPDLTHTIKATPYGVLVIVYRVP